MSSCGSQGVTSSCRLAAEVERLQPLAERTAELEASLEAHKEELAMLRSANASTSSDEVIHLSLSNASLSAQVLDGEHMLKREDPWTSVLPSV